jgi:hypothetical protein
MPQAVPFAGLLLVVASSPALLARQVAAAHSVFFNWSLSLTTPLLGHSLLCPDVVDVTDTDFDAKVGLQLCLDPAGRNLRVSGTYLDEPRLRLYRSTCTDGRGDHPGTPWRLSPHREQAGQGGRLLNERSSTDGCRCCGPPRLTCTHRLDELQERGTSRAVFHPMYPSFSGYSSTLLGRIVPCWTVPV